ncbi:MAG TPA: RNA polymerase sigma factor [Ignavibacteriaceae bacterium]|nr:RNA polymerase sigma factor [Ignavibacteriaceae bacterium]
MNQDNKFIRSLIQSSLRGNNSALEQLFSMNLNKVYTLTLRLTSNFSSAEKLTEEVLVEAWKQIKYLREDATFSSWITGITVYQCLKYLRENDNPKPQQASQLPSKDHLEKVILDLPKNERIVMVLHYFEKYTIDEISDLLAVSGSDAKMYLEEGEKKVITRSPDLSDAKNITEEINRIRVDMKPENDLINQAFVTIYKTKSEDEVKDQFLKEKQSSEDSNTDEQEKNKKGLGGLFKKILPKSKK